MDIAGRVAVVTAGASGLGGHIAAALLAIVTAILFGAGPLHLPATIATVQSKGNWQSIPGFIGTRLGLGTVGHPVALMLGVEVLKRLRAERRLVRLPAI